MAKAKKVVKKAKAVKKKQPAKKKIVKKKIVSKKPTANKSVKKSAKKVITKKVKAIKPARQPQYDKVVTPLGERVLVRLAQAEAVTAGGIIIPGTVVTQAGYMKATVLAVGTGSKTKKGVLKPLDVKVGDTILFQRHVAVKIEHNGEELFILNESNILGTV